MLVAVLLLLEMAALGVDPAEQKAAPDMCPHVLALLTNTATSKQTEELKSFIRRRGKKEVDDTDRQLQGAVYDTFHASFDMMTEQGITDPVYVMEFHAALLDLEYAMRQTKTLIKCIKRAPEAIRRSTAFLGVIWGDSGYEADSGDDDDVAADKILDRLIAKEDQWRVLPVTLHHKMSEGPLYKQEYDKCEARYDTLSGAQTAKRDEEVKELIATRAAMRESLAKLDQDPTAEAVVSVLVEKMEVKTKELFDQMVGKNDAAEKLMVGIVRDAMGVRNQEVEDLKRNCQRQQREILRALDKNNLQILAALANQFTFPTGWSYCVFYVISLIPLMFFLYGTATCLCQVIWHAKIYKKEEVGEAAVNSLISFFWALVLEAGAAIALLLFHIFDASWVVAIAVGIVAWYAYRHD